MNFISKIDYQQLITIAFDAKDRLLISLPGIDDTLAEALLAVKHDVEIKVVIDNSEDSIRNGYGEIDAIEKLRNRNISVRECSGNLVSFIIADEDGYFLFPQSRIFAAEPSGPNAVSIDPITVQLLALNYFPDAKLKDIAENIKTVLTASECIDFFKVQLTQFQTQVLKSSQ
jgi:hypothetical protein